MKNSHRPVVSKRDAAELGAHRPYLLRFAAAQVRQKDVAEDLVQETLVAAVSAVERFSGQSSVRTWLTGILLHKISDYRRAAGREMSLDARWEESGADDYVEALFAENGGYVQPPADWGDPERALGEQEFFAVLDGCVEDLPEAAAQVFLLRELMGLSVAEICKELNISATNCSVMLHRARMRLRGCLERRWFETADRRA
jgi:RNA polymerase sigma-70 factor, ECF subfamily